MIQYFTVEKKISDRLRAILAWIYCGSDPYTTPINIIPLILATFQGMYLFWRMDAYEDS